MNAGKRITTTENERTGNQCLPASARSASPLNAGSHHEARRSLLPLRFRAQPEAFIPNPPTPGGALAGVPNAAPAGAGFTSNSSPGAGRPVRAPRVEVLL